MIEGILHPLITPFSEEGDVDEDVFRSLLDGALDVGVHGFFLLGSQGQGPALTHEERSRTAALAIRHVAGRVPVVIHVGTTDLRSTAELARRAEEAGADAVAAVPPYYYSDHTEAEIDAHFKGLSEATSLPIFVYNNPKYAGADITPSWLARLAGEIPNLSGIKLSYASPQQILQYIDQVPERISVFSGSVLNLLSTVPFGVKGAINPPAVLFPELSVAIWEALKAEDWGLAFEIQGRINRAAITIARLVAKFGRPVYREGFRIMGYDVKTFPRWESGELTDEALAQLRDVIEASKMSPATTARAVS